MKKGYIRGVLTCDPSWRGLAFTIHVPTLNYNESVVMDLGVLLDNKKTLTQPFVYIPLVVIAVNRLIKTRPAVRLCDKFIIESQFQENMKMLSTVIVTVILSRLKHLSVERLSSLTCKRKYSVPYGDGHYSNKKNMFEYVQENKDKLIAGDTLKDHNTADSIIILNTWLSLKQRHLYKTLEEFATGMDDSDQIHYDVPFDLGGWFTCPRCEYDTGKMYLVKNPPKDPERYKDMRGWFFMSCKNEDCRAGPSYLSKKLPVLVQVGSAKQVGNAVAGIWKKATTGNRPPPKEKAVADGCFNTVPVTRLAGVKRQEREDDPINVHDAKKKTESNPLASLVEALEAKQNALERSIADMGKKSDETMNKLLMAITGGGAPLVPKEPKKKKSQLRKEHYQKLAESKKFNVDDLEENDNVQVVQ